MGLRRVVAVEAKWRRKRERGGGRERTGRWVR